jgi:type I restriction enzyme, R subunit
MAIFVDSGFGTAEDVALATAEHGGLGLYLRSLTGLDHKAAAAAFDQFRVDRTFSPPLRGYLDLLIDALAKNGLVAIGDLYEASFTLRAPHGPEDLFASTEIDAIEHVLDAIRATAQPAGASAD